MTLDQQEEFSYFYTLTLLAAIEEFIFSFYDIAHLSYVLNLKKGRSTLSKCIIAQHGETSQSS